MGRRGGTECLYYFSLKKKNRNNNPTEFDAALNAPLLSRSRWAPAIDYSSFLPVSKTNLVVAKQQRRHTRDE